MDHLSMELPNTLQHRIQFQIVSNHGAARDQRYSIKKKSAPTTSTRKAVAIATELFSLERFMAEAISPSPTVMAPANINIADAIRRTLVELMFLAFWAPSLTRSSA